MQPLSSPAHTVARSSWRELAPSSAEPEALLRAYAGEARGFWGRDGRWTAWGGVADRLEVEHDPEADRFERLRQLVERTSGRGGEWRRVAPERRPRYFGGLAFAPDTKVDDGFWEGFPAAGFVLPRVRLDRTPDGARLVAFGPDPEAREAELDRVAERLEAAPALANGKAPLRPEVLERAPGVPDRGRWEDAVERVLAAVSRGELSKAVLARAVDARARSPVDPLRSLCFLRADNPGTHVFLVEPRPGRIFLGAAPEVLARVRGHDFRATVVAGSVPRGGDVAEDRRLARILERSAKDRAEHLLTAEEMVEVLGPRLVRKEVEEEPRVLTLARIQHLESVIRGRTNEGEDVLSLVAALHPTPAVCGRPREAALALIRSAEPFDRGWYAGPVGWFDPAGDGTFVPALRSAVGSAERWRLFAGAGIVAGSVPDAEWVETTLKLEPALRGLEAGVEPPA